jgi:hypothetical protein
MLLFHIIILKSKLYQSVVINIFVDFFVLSTITMLFYYFIHIGINNYYKY